MPTVDSQVGGSVRAVAHRAAGSDVPSFHRRCLEIQRQYRRQVAAGKVDGAFAWTRDRIARRELLADIGVRTAALWHEVTSDTLTADVLARPCVLKNAVGASSIGLAILDAPEDGRWLNVRTGQRRSLDDLRAGMRLTLEQYPHWPDLWHIEERLYPAQGRTLREYQVFVFGAAVIPAARIHQSEMGYTHKGWVDGEWNPVDTGLPATGTVAPPDDPDGVHALALHVAAAIPSPFARVDVWETSSGLAVGEVNDHHGGSELFTSGWDRYLGLLWDLAEREMAMSTSDRVRVSEPAPPPDHSATPRLVSEPAPAPAAPKRRRTGGKRERGGQ